MQRARLAAGVISVVLVGASLEPLARDPRDDGFPLSTYPMFATPRPTRLTLHYALGEGRHGERIVLEPALVGTGEVLQAMRVFQQALARGRAEVGSLCEAIAARARRDDDYARVAAIRIVTGSHDAIDYLVRDRIGHEIERHRCEVRR